jgi:hypothetical protein
MTAPAPVLIRVCAAFAVAVVGGALSGALGRTHRQLCGLISLGAGTLLGVTVLVAVCAGGGFGLRRLCHHQQIPFPRLPGLCGKPF